MALPFRNVYLPPEPRVHILTGETYDLVIRGGRIVTTHEDYCADIAICGERIAAVGSDLRGAIELDATGMLVLPGAIDGHVHMRSDRPVDVYDDTFETGSIAAAHGGVTTMLDQAQVEPGQSLDDGLDKRLGEAEEASLIDYGFHVNLREPNLARVAEIPGIIARGFSRFKLFMYYDTYALPDDIIFAAMQAVAAHDGLAIVHAENAAVINEILRQNAVAGRTGPMWNARARPPFMDGEAAHRALAIARTAGARALLYHMTTADAVRELGAARARGQEAYGEVCPQYLLLGEESWQDPQRATALDFSPPLRPPEHREALWAALAAGAVDIVSTDHGPRKRRPDDRGELYIPPGTSGIEVRLALTYTFGVRTGRLSLNRWVDACCTAPARVFRLPTKGKLLPGFDADIVIFDPDRQMTLTAERLHSNIDYATYEGMTVDGLPVTTISRGEVIVRDGELCGSPGRGRLITDRVGESGPDTPDAARALAQ